MALWTKAALRPSVLRGKLLELPTELAIALGRLCLAVTIVVAVSIHLPSGSEQIALSSILTVYLALAVLIVLLSGWNFGNWFLFSQQAVDIFVTCMLIYMSDGSTSPFFLLFVFNLVVGLLRWNWRGAAATSFIIAAAHLFLPLQFAITPSGSLRLLDIELSRVVLRGGFLLVCGAMLAYLGAHRERDRRRFAQLATCPGRAEGAPGNDNLSGSLGHAAMVMQVPRVLVVWEEHEEPHQNVAIWAEEAIELSVQPPGTFLLPKPDAEAEVRFFNRPRWASQLDPSGCEIIDLKLQAQLNIRTAAFVAFHNELCSGTLFMLDRPNWIEEDIPLIRIIASRLGIEIEDQALRRRLEENLISRERMRLGRDLHDGVLQGLAAADMQLKLIADASPLGLKNHVKAVRDTLTNEAYQIREFVEETRIAAVASPASIDFAAALEARSRALETQWGCKILLEVERPKQRVPSPTIRHLEHILTEAVSNAVRHGGASQVDVSVSESAGNLTLRICDNGSGFHGTPASTPGEPIGRPLSLRSRIEELGGQLIIAPAPKGADLYIELPA